MKTQQPYCCFSSNVVGSARSPDIIAAWDAAAAEKRTIMAIEAMKGATTLATSTEPRRTNAASEEGGGRKQERVRSWEAGEGGREQGIGTEETGRGTSKERE